MQKLMSIRIPIYVAIIAVFAGPNSAATCFAQENKSNNPSSSGAQTQKTAAKNEPKDVAKKDPYLGIVVQPLHPAIWAHLRDVMEHKQGLVVARVAKASPAEVAGVLPHDILMTYDNQKLFYPQQLVSLIHTDKVGRQVKLEIVRAGKPETLQVALGEQPKSPIEAPETPLEERRHVWERFDSLTLKNLGNGRFNVTIEYKTKDGKLEHRNFEGTREEIRTDILAQKEMPQDEQHDLLRALDMPRTLEMDVPRFFISPDGRVFWEFGDF